MLIESDLTWLTTTPMSQSPGESFLRVEEYTHMHGNGSLSVARDQRKGGEVSLYDLEQIAGERAWRALINGRQGDARLDNFTDSRSGVELVFRRGDLQDPEKRAAIIRGIEAAIENPETMVPDDMKATVRERMIAAMDLIAARKDAILAADPEGKIAKTVAAVLENPEWRPEGKEA